MHHFDCVHEGCSYSGDQTEYYRLLLNIVCMLQKTEENAV
jgi:hypothetical protein